MKKEIKGKKTDKFVNKLLGKKKTAKKGKK
jgi:hypothetical protein